MTAASIVRSAALIGTLVGVALTVSGLTLNSMHGDRGTELTRAAATGESQPRVPTQSDSLARAIAHRNPFRSDRRSSRIAFDPAVVRGAAAAPVATPDPNLIGVVGGGSSFAAVLRGFPGLEGARVLGPGERAGAYTVRAVYDDSAIVAGPDSLLRLRLRRGPS